MERIDIDGNVHGSDHVHLEKKIEPNIIATSSTDNLYNYLNKNLKEEDNNMLKYKKNFFPRKFHSISTNQK